VSAYTWRERSRAVIACVLNGNPANLKAALFDAYPFGQRRYHPYKIWCEEVAAALGKPRKPKARKGTPARRDQEMAEATLTLPGVA
jgi:hypothetical protein